MNRPTAASAEAREEQDAGRDVDGGAEPAHQVPGGDVVERAERPEASEHGCERREERGADRELERRGADGVGHSRRELHVGAGLDGEQGSDEEQEGDGDGFHNLTVVKIA
jgi:hypothetical protein